MRYNEHQTILHTYEVTREAGKVSTFEHVETAIDKMFSITKRKQKYVQAGYIDGTTNFKGTLYACR
jgi:hypothetical protein